MKRISEQTHYEILEVAQDATPEQIERAYRVVHATYATDSLAAYSVYDEAELGALQERIELAYASSRTPSVAAPTTRRWARVRASSSRSASPSRTRTSPSPRARPRFAASRRASTTDLSTARALRRWRIARGIELDQIASVTKISVSYLRSLEEERFDALPATVYVRGFVTAYARASGSTPPPSCRGTWNALALARPEKPRRAVVRRAR